VRISCIGREALSALDETLTWSATAPAWLRDAIRRIATAPEITDADVVDLVNLCKIPHGLTDTSATPDPIASKDISSPSAVGAVALTSITHVSDVNALAPNETLSFGPTGITVIYGDNGAGKSGFSRIMRRACRARGLRFRPGVETQRLKKIGDIQQTDLDAIQRGMTKCSKWEGGHDQPLATNERHPAPDELKKDIDELETWVNAVKKKDARKAPPVHTEACHCSK